MTKFYAAQDVGVDDGTIPLVIGEGHFRGAPIHSLIKTLDLSANAVLIGDTIDWGGLGKGIVPVAGFLLSSVSLGSSTLDVGTAATAALFKAAAVFTAVDTPTLFMKNGAFGVPLTAATR